MQMSTIADTPAGFEIGLSPDAVTDPIRFNLAFVESAMLWPDDPEGRQLWERAAMLKEGEGRIDDMPAEVLRQFTKDALSIPRLPELNERAAKRHTHGLIAGIIVLEAVALADVDPERGGVDAIRQYLSDSLRGVFQISPGTMKNPEGPVMKFRPVAHLWASWWWQVFFGGGDLTTFPCKRADLAVFVARAEAIRLRAEALRTPHSSTTVMVPGEAASLPGDVSAVLPRVTLHFIPDASGVAQVN